MSKQIFQVTNMSFPFQEQVNLTDLSVQDVSNVHIINKFVEVHADEIADQFYNKILSVPHLKSIIEQHSTVDKLKRTMKRHIQQMFTAKLDDEYVAERKQIALIHYLVKLEPKWYIAAFQYLFNSIQLILMREYENKEEVAYLSTIVAKYISLEMQIVLEAYETKVLSNIEIDNLLQNLMDDDTLEE